MNRLFSALVFLCLMTSAFAQITQNDGYYFNDGKLYTGIYEQTDDQGTLSARISIRKGLPDGISEYYSGGTIIEKRSFRRGVKHGLWEKFEAGIKVSEATYKHDKKHGKWLVWDTAGTLRYEMYYKKGKKTGVWKMWDDQGKLIREKEY